jgi:hypothetical protein
MTINCKLTTRQFAKFFMESSASRKSAQDCSTQSHVQTRATKIVKPFLANHSMVEISHSPYSSKLVSAKFLLFRKIKYTLKIGKISGYGRHQKELNHQTECSSFGCLRYCFCADFRKTKKYAAAVKSDYFERNVK